METSKRAGRAMWSWWSTRAGGASSKRRAPEEDTAEAEYVRALDDDLVALDAWRMVRAFRGWECRPYRSGQTLTATIRPTEGWLSGAPAQPGMASAEDA
jgi:hypothetical protein